MPIASFLRLSLTGGVALVAAAAPGLAQSASPTLVRPSDPFVAAGSARRATNLQRPPIVISYFTTVALNTRAAGNAQTAASGVRRQGQN